jgi:hypothetical protein
MTNLELILTMLAEASATEISIMQQPSGFFESARIAKQGAETAKAAREQHEMATGESAISSRNAMQIRQKKKPRLS